MNWDIYLFVLQASKNYSSRLSKIAIVSLVISDVCFSGSEQFLRINNRVLLNLVIFMNDESSL